MAVTLPKLDRIADRFRKPTSPALTAPYPTGEDSLELLGTVSNKALGDKTFFTIAGRHGWEYVRDRFSRDVSGDKEWPNAAVVESIDADGERHYLTLKEVPAGSFAEAQARLAPKPAKRPKLPPHPVSDLAGIPLLRTPERTGPPMRPSVTIRGAPGIIARLAEKGTSVALTPDRMDVVPLTSERRHYPGVLRVIEAAGRPLLAPYRRDGKAPPCAWCGTEAADVLRGMAWCGTCSPKAAA